MKIHVKKLPHPEKNHDYVYANIIRPELGIVTLADGMGGKGQTNAAHASKTVCKQVVDGLSNIIEKIRDKQELSMEERRNEIRRDLVDLIVEINNQSLTGRPKIRDGVNTVGETTFQAGIIDLENKTIQVENIGDSSIFLVYTDRTFDYLTPRPDANIKPGSRPNKRLGVYAHIGDEFNGSNVKRDLSYYRISFDGQVEIYSRENEYMGRADEYNRTINKQLARIVFATDGVTNTLKHDELEAIIAGAPIDENYDLYLLTQLSVAARYPYRKILDRLDDVKARKILTELLWEDEERLSRKEQLEGDLIRRIVDTGIDHKRFRSIDELKGVIYEIADTETGREVRRYLGERLSHIDDTTIVSVDVSDQTLREIYCMPEKEQVDERIAGMISYGPYTRQLPKDAKPIPTISDIGVGEEPIFPGDDIHEPDSFPDDPTDPSLDMEIIVSENVGEEKTPGIIGKQIATTEVPYVGQELEDGTDDVDNFKQWFDEYEQTKANLANALSTIAEQTGRLTELELIIASEQKERATLSVDLEELRRINREYEDNLGKTTVELDEARVALQAKYGELEKVREELATKTQNIETKTQELEEVNRRLESATEDVDGLRASLEGITTQYETSITELNSEHDTVIARIREEHNTIIRTYEKRIANYEKKVKEYETASTEQETLISKLNTTITNYETRIAEQQTTMIEYEATIGRLRESNETITARVNELESLYSEASRKQSEAVARIEELLNGSDAYKDYISPEEYGKALADKDAKHANALEAITSQHTTALEAKEKEVKARYTGYLSNEDHLKIVREAQEAIETRYAGQQEELERLRKLDELKGTRVSELELKLGELTENYDQRLGEIEQLDCQITELTRSREENSEIIGSLRSEFEEKADELTQISERYSTTSTELEELKTQYAEGSTALDEANVKIVQYERELEELGSLRGKITTYQGIEERLEHAKAAKTAVDGMLESAQRLVEERLEYSRGLEAQLEEVRTEKTETERLLEEAIEKVADYDDLHTRLTEAERAVQDYEARITELKESYEATIKNLQTRITAVEQERDDRVPQDKYNADIATARKEAEEAGRLTAQTEADERYKGYVAPDLVARREEQARELGAITGRDEMRRTFKDYVAPNLVVRREKNARDDGQAVGRIEGLREGEEEKRTLEAENRRLTKLLDEKVTELAVDMKTVESIRESLYNMQIRINNHTSDIFGATQIYYSRSEIKDNPKNTRSNAKIIDEEGRVNEKEMGVTYKKSEYHPERGTTHVFNVRGNLYRIHEKGKKQGQAKGDAKSIDMDCYVREVHDEATGQTRYEIDTKSLEISAEAKHDILYSMTRILNISDNDVDSTYAKKEKVKSAKRLTDLPSTEMKQEQHPDGIATVIQGEMYHTKNGRFNNGKPTGPASEITIMYQPVTR